MSIKRFKQVLERVVDAAKKEFSLINETAPREFIQQALQRFDGGKGNEELTVLSIEGYEDVRLVYYETHGTHHLTLQADPQEIEQDVFEQCRRALESIHIGELEDLRISARALTAQKFAKFLGKFTSVRTFESLGIT